MKFIMVMQMAWKKPQLNIHHYLNMGKLFLILFQWSPTKHSLQDFQNNAAFNMKTFESHPF